MNRPLRPVVVRAALLAGSFLIGRKPRAAVPAPAGVGAGSAETDATVNARLPPDAIDWSSRRCRLDGWPERNSAWIVGIVGFLLARDAATQLGLFGLG